MSAPGELAEASEEAWTRHLDATRHALDQWTSALKTCERLFAAAPQGDGRLDALGAAFSQFWMRYTRAALALDSALGEIDSAFRARTGRRP